jgi:hypothetical protein
MNDHRRPAGVDPTVLRPAQTLLDAQAQAIGRRVAAKVVASRAGAAPETVFHALDGLDLDPDDLAAIVEAEIRSTHGTPPLGVVDVRLSYPHAQTLLFAIVDAHGATKCATDRDNLVKLRRIFFEALGLPFSC